MKFVIVILRFNLFIIDEFLKGCLDGFKRYDVDSENIDVYYVSGVFEIFFVCKKFVKLKKYNVIIVFGVVICGSILYFEYVSVEVLKGIVNVFLE